jgi:hypothetical protein
MLCFGNFVKVTAFFGVLFIDGRIIGSDGVRWVKREQCKGLKIMILIT